MDNPAVSLVYLLKESSVSLFFFFFLEEKSCLIPPASSNLLHRQMQAGRLACVTFSLGHTKKQGFSRGMEGSEAT